MKVYAVCPQCDDYYYGFNHPNEIFDSFEKAKEYVLEYYKKNGYPQPTFDEYDDYYGVRCKNNFCDFIIKDYELK